MRPVPGGWGGYYMTRRDAQQFPDDAIEEFAAGEPDPRPEMPDDIDWYWPNEPDAFDFFEPAGVTT